MELEIDLKEYSNEEILKKYKELYGEAPIVEPLEYWLVSSWLAERLKIKREMVIEYPYLPYPIWGRETTGQLIVDDYVIKSIMKEF